MHRGFTFGRFARNRWISGRCDYLKEKERTGHALSPQYIQESRKNLDTRIPDHFKGRKLPSIRVKDIRDWIFYPYEELETNPATINRSLATLEAMLKEAARLGFIRSNSREKKRSVCRNRLSLS